MAGQFERYWAGPDEVPWPLRACEGYAVAADPAWRKLNEVAVRIYDDAPVCFDERHRRVVIPLPSAVVRGGRDLTAWVIPDGDGASILHVDVPRAAEDSADECRRLQAVVEDFRSKVAADLPRRI